jgi:very-short-patch-repair endonuclease
VLPRDRLERALAQAEYRRYPDSPSLHDLLERHAGRRGLATLRGLLASADYGRGITRSLLEDRFLRFLDRYRLRRPELNAPLSVGAETVYVDCLWRALGIALELDGRAAHLRERAFESDRLRDRQLSAIGLRPVRVTAVQLGRDPQGLAAGLRALGVGRDTV